MPKSLDDILATAKLPEDTFPICLRADLQAEWEQAAAALQDLDEAFDADADRDRANTTAGMARQRKQAAERVQAIEARMADETLEFTIRGLPFADYNRLILKHPARDGSATDRAFGFNTDTLFPDLIRACVVTPQVTDEQWTLLLSKLTDRQWDRFTSAAIEVNRRQDGSVPFSQRASELTRGSGGTSNSRRPSA